MPKPRPLILVYSIRRLHRTNSFHLLHHQISKELWRNTKKKEGNGDMGKRKRRSERKKKRAKRETTNERKRREGKGKN